MQPSPPDANDCVEDWLPESVLKDSLINAFNANGPYKLLGIVRWRSINASEGTGESPLAPRLGDYRLLSGITRFQSQWIKT